MKKNLLKSIALWGIIAVAVVMNSCKKDDAGEPTTLSPSSVLSRADRFSAGLFGNVKSVTTTSYDNVTWDTLATSTFTGLKGAIKLDKKTVSSISTTNYNGEGFTTSSSSEVEVITAISATPINEWDPYYPATQTARKPSSVTTITLDQKNRATLSESVSYQYSYEIGGEYAFIYTYNDGTVCLYTYGDG
jgi:hypothetical protein